MSVIEVIDRQEGIRIGRFLETFNAKRGGSTSIIDLSGEGGIRSREVSHYAVVWDESPSECSTSDILIVNAGEGNIVNHLPVRSLGYVLFNADSVKLSEIIGEEYYPVSFGFNGKTSVTASSIDKVESLSIMYCLQRTLFTLNGKVIEPFEIPLEYSGSRMEIYTLLAGITTLLILDVEIDS